MRNVSQKFEMMKTDRLTLSGWRCKAEAISASHLEGFLTQSTFEKSKHARTRTTGRDRRGGTYTTDLDAACLLAAEVAEVCLRNCEEENTI
jgi:hypothetical protein